MIINPILPTFPLYRYRKMAEKKGGEENLLSQHDKTVGNVLCPVVAVSLTHADIPFH